MGFLGDIVGGVGDLLSDAKDKFEDVLPGGKYDLSLNWWKGGLTTLLGGEVPQMPNPAQPARASTSTQARRGSGLNGTMGARGFSSPSPPTLLTGGRGTNTTDSLLGTSSLLGR
jgi:hypothetical protein